MPPIMVAILVLLIIFAWFIMGGEKSAGDKMTVLLIFLGLYLGYRLLNGASVTEALVDPIVAFFNR